MSSKSRSNAVKPLEHYAQKVGAYEDLREDLQDHFEPMLTYAIEAWYPSQVVLQNTIERVQKFASKLRTNDFTSWHCSRNYNGSPSTKLQWRNVTSHAQSHPGPPKLPDQAVMHCKDHNRRRRTRRTGHELELIIPVSTLEVVTSSSLNTTKKI
jgi:hypothetical protein